MDLLLLPRGVRRQAGDRRLERLGPLRRGAKQRREPFGDLMRRGGRGKAFGQREREGATDTIV
ncbi:hypothetical protein D3C86_2247390 [compost metagenome]